MIYRLNDFLDETNGRVTTTVLNAVKGFGPNLSPPGYIDLSEPGCFSALTKAPSDRNVRELDCVHGLSFFFSVSLHKNSVYGLTYQIKPHFFSDWRVAWGT